MVYILESMNITCGRFKEIRYLNHLPKLSGQGDWKKCTEERRLKVIYQNTTNYTQMDFCIWSNFYKDPKGTWEGPLEKFILKFSGRSKCPEWLRKFWGKKNNEGTWPPTEKKHHTMKPLKLKVRLLVCGQTVQWNRTKHSETDSCRI